MAEKTDKTMKPEENKDIKQETKMEEKTETKVEAKAEEKKIKKEQKQIVKKEEAIARGLDLPLSKKHSMYICDFIKGKKIDSAISDLQEVLKFKKFVPMRGEIPHRKGKVAMAGRYPIKASQYFINLLKLLKGNSIANGLDLDKTRIVIGSANWASRPSKRGGARFKRTHVTLIAREIKEAKK